MTIRKVTPYIWPMQQRYNASECPWGIMFLLVTHERGHWFKEVERFGEIYIKEADAEKALILQCQCDKAIAEFEAARLREAGKR